MTDPKAILDDASIGMVIELIGGVTVAKDVVMTAIAKGKHVVTGNKALIAAHLPEIQAALKEKPVFFGYEAAVCGGIPIIDTLASSYVGDTITSVKGIMNGTTNFILSKMESEGANYADVLAEAQALGFAETPPDFDVEGWDARSKLAILVKLAFGVFVPEESIECNGITRVSSEDFQYAKLLNSTVKILGVANQEEDGSVSAYVSICIVPFTNQLSRVAGALNCVSVTSKNLSTCVYSGPGAGRFPTANSVVSDMVAIAKKGVPQGNPFVRDSEIAFMPASRVGGPRMRFYIRFVIKDGVGIVRILGELAEKNGISIHSMLQTPIVDTSRVPMVITTDPTSWHAVKQMGADCEKQPFNLEPPLIMPLFD